jgi:hypothetical protein
LVFDFVITYRKGSKNTRADVLSRRQDYTGKPTERPRVILKEIKDSMEYNYKLLAIIAVIKSKELEIQIKNIYAKNKCTTRILKELTKGFRVDQQGLFWFKGLVYVPAKIRKEFARE